MFPIPVPTLELERTLAAGRDDLIVGFDEVGRGALAGPVMVGAVALWARDLPDTTVPDGVADSKLLTARHRERLIEPLEQWSAAYAVGQCTNAEIDAWGISHALGIAALRALHRIEHDLGIDAPTPLNGTSMDANRVGASPVSAMPQLDAGPAIGAILDGPFDYITPASSTFDAPELAIPAVVTTHVKADQLSATVAAASVIAKVTRDRFMVSLAAGNPRYAPYDWPHNKGYGSPAHRAAIRRYGITALHRASWHLT